MSIKGEGQWLDEVVCDAFPGAVNVLLCPL